MKYQQLAYKKIDLIKIFINKLIKYELEKSVIW